MTESDEQKRILESIDKLIAGESVDDAGITGESEKTLLELARELRKQRPQPADGFEQELLERLKPDERRETADGVTGREKGQGRRRWLPRWVTLPRAAAVAAALVLGLGAAGLTGAIISGGGPGSSNSVAEKSSEAVSSYVAPESDVLDSAAARDQASSGGAGFAQEAPGAVSPGSSESSVGSGAAADIPSTRQVIQTADYEIEIASGEFKQKYDQITDLAARYGGYVASANTTASDDEDAIQRGTVTIRIADTGDNFSKAMAELDGLGRVVSRNVSGQDVTEQYVDLQSRLKNAQAHEASLLDLMAKAQTIDEMLMVESQLNTVRSEIEELQGQINYLDNRTDYASITIEMYEEDAAAQDSDDSTDDWGFLSALRYAGWLSVQTVNFIIMAMGIIIPVALILTLVLIVTYRLMQRRRSGN